MGLENTGADLMHASACLFEGDKHHYDDELRLDYNFWLVPRLLPIDAVRPVGLQISQNFLIGPPAINATLILDTDHTSFGAPYHLQ
jgi:hypothetical protein